MAIYNGPLETVDCHIHSVRYDMAVNREAGGISDASSELDTIWPSTEELAAVSDASSGHLRRCSDADMPKQCLSRDKDASKPSWPTIMGH
eukprot:scaffold152_cov121-Skeletonema_marinoi.AAC.1